MSPKGTRALDTMPASDYALLASEVEFASAVIEYARRCHWKVHFLPDWLFRLAIREIKQRPRKGHDWPDKGFVDLILCRARPGEAPIQCLAVELKVGRNTTTEEQRWWMGCLLAVGLDVRTWTPKDWSVIGETLK